MFIFRIILFSELDHLVRVSGATDFNNLISFVPNVFEAFICVEYCKIPNVSKICKRCVVGSLHLRSSHGDNRVKYIY